MIAMLKRRPKTFATEGSVRLRLEPNAVSARAIKDWGSARLRLRAKSILNLTLTVCALVLMGAYPAAAFQVAAIGESQAAVEDGQRRQLNDRLAEMVQDGHSRLPETVAALSSSPSRAQMSPVNRSASRGGYRAPSLDLTTPPRIPASDVECLAQAIYYEARNETEQGQAAVAEVVMNRSRALGYPPRVCDVVYQRNSRTCQFTFTCDGAIGRSPVNALAWARAEAIAREVYEGRRQSVLPPSSLNYHASYVRPSWASRLQRVSQIGTHIFYGNSLTGGPTPGASASETPRSGGGLVFTRNAALEEAYARAMQAGS